MELSSRPKRSEVDLLFLFCPSDLTAPNKSHHPPLCHPERSRGICGAPRLPRKDPRSVSFPTDSSSLSAAPHRCDRHSACSAESKDLGGAHLTHAARSFWTAEARQQDPLRYRAGHSKMLASSSF